MAHIVPIYVAEVSVSLMRRANLSKYTTVFYNYRLPRQIVKGFNLEDIKKRSAPTISQHASEFMSLPKEKGFEYFYTIGKINLLAQLGHGVND